MSFFLFFFWDSCTTRDPPRIKTRRSSLWRWLYRLCWSSSSSSSSSICSGQVIDTHSLSHTHTMYAVNLHRLPGVIRRAAQFRVKDHATVFCFFVLFCFLCRSSLLNSHNLPAASSDHLRRSSSSAFFSFLSLSHPCWVKAYSWCWFFFFTLFKKNLYHYVVTGLRSTSRQEATQPPSDWPMAGRTIQVCVWERETLFTCLGFSWGLWKSL